MPKKERCQFIKPNHPDIPIARQCELLGLSRTGYYCRPRPERKKNICLMRRIDEIYTKYPYYGAPKIIAQLNREKEKINHKRVERSPTRRNLSENISILTITNASMSH